MIIVLPLTRTGIPASWGLSNRFFSSVLLAWSDDCGQMIGQMILQMIGQMIGQMIVVKKLEVANFKVAHLNLLRVSTVHHVDYGIDASAVPFPH